MLARAATCVSSTTRPASTSVSARARARKRCTSSGRCPQDDLKPVGAQRQPVIFRQRRRQVAGGVSFDEIGAGAGAERPVHQRRPGDQAGGDRGTRRAGGRARRGSGHRGMPLGAVSRPDAFNPDGGIAQSDDPARARNSARIKPASRFDLNGFRWLALSFTLNCCNCQTRCAPKARDARQPQRQRQAARAGGQHRQRQPTRPRPRRKPASQRGVSARTAARWT